MNHFNFEDSDEFSEVKNSSKQSIKKRVKVVINDKEMISMKKVCEARDYHSSIFKRQHIFEEPNVAVINLSDSKDSKLNNWVEMELASIIKMNQIEIDYSKESILA